MQSHTDCSSPKVASKKRFFSETSSFGSPESFKWWRKVSATKTKPPPTEKVKKTPVQNRGCDDSLKKSPKHLVINEKMEKNPFHNRGNYGTNIKKNYDFLMKIAKDLAFKGEMEETPFLRDEGDEERVRLWSSIELFRAKCLEISVKRASSSSDNGGHRIDFRAKEELTKQGKLSIRSSKVIGPVPGVNAGDRFNYRVELIIAGLHSRNQHGIDYMVYNGNFLATCIVAKKEYDDKMTDSEAITYVGEGGSMRTNQGEVCKDQRLTFGNLAMKNSMVAKNDVRVVRGLAYGGGVYVYDGLYRVVSYEEKRGPWKNLIYQFKLVRCPGQPVVSWSKFKVNA